MLIDLQLRLSEGNLWDGGSARVEVSQVLPGLEMAMVEEVLKRGRAEDDGAINRWLIEQFSLVAN